MSLVLFISINIYEADFLLNQLFLGISDIILTSRFHFLSSKNSSPFPLVFAIPANPTFAPFSSPLRKQLKLKFPDKWSRVYWGQTLDDMRYFQQTLLSVLPTIFDTLGRPLWLCPRNCQI